MLTEALALAAKEEEGKTVIFASRGPEWRPLGRPRTKRKLSSVILQDGLAERLHQDIIQFIENQAWYTERGIISLYYCVMAKPYRKCADACSFHRLHGP